MQLAFTGTFTRNNSSHPVQHDDGKGQFNKDSITFKDEYYCIQPCLGGGGGGAGASIQINFLPQSQIT